MKSVLVYTTDGRRRNELGKQVTRAHNNIFHDHKIIWSKEDKDFMRIKAKEASIYRDLVSELVDRYKTPQDKALVKIQAKKMLTKAVHAMAASSIDGAPHF